MANCIAGIYLDFTHTIVPWAQVEGIRSHKRYVRLVVQMVQSDGQTRSAGVAGFEVAAVEKMPDGGLTVYVLSPTPNVAFRHRFNADGTLFVNEPIPPSLWHQVAAGTDVRLLEQPWHPGNPTIQAEYNANQIAAFGVDVGTC